MEIKNFDKFISQKYNNFISFLELNIKEEHKDKLQLLPDNVNEFLAYIMALEYDSIDDMINQLSQSFNISKNEYDEHIYNKFKLYLELFYDTVNKPQE